jgi:hypothetical protein
VGDADPVDSTREVGVFLLPLAVLLPAGMYGILRQRRTAADMFVLLGFIVAPMSALIADEVKMSRVLVIVPFAALIAARGVETLLGSRRIGWRLVAIGLLAGSLVQFPVFYRDYFTGYRERSAARFDGNRGGAIEAMLSLAAREPRPPLYVSRAIPMVRYFWQFYVIKNGRADLMDEVVYFDENLDIGRLPAGSLLLSPVASDGGGPLDRSSALKRVAVIANADSHPAFAIYEK